MSTSAILPDPQPPRRVVDATNLLLQKYGVAPIDVARWLARRMTVAERDAYGSRMHRHAPPEEIGRAFDAARDVARVLGRAVCPVEVYELLYGTSATARFGPPVAEYYDPCAPAADVPSADDLLAVLRSLPAPSPAPPPPPPPPAGAPDLCSILRSLAANPPVPAPPRPAAPDLASILRNVAAASARPPPPPFSIPSADDLRAILGAAHVRAAA